MDRKRKMLVAIAVFLVVVAGIIPPWKLGPYRGMEKAGPYKPIWMPPAGYSIDINRLVIEWIIIAVIAGALWLVLKKKE